MDSEKFRCPFDDIECTEVDNETMVFKISCNDCARYHGRVRQTGAVPILDWIIEKIKKRCARSAS